MNTVLNLFPLSNDTTVTGPAPFPFLPFFFLPSSSPQPLKSGAGKESSTKSPPGGVARGHPGKLASPFPSASDRLACPELCPVA